jgi:hypothetical protein
MEIDPKKIFQTLITNITKDLMKNGQQDETLSINNKTKMISESDNPLFPPPVYPQTIYSKIKFKKYNPSKVKKNTFTSIDEEELRITMKAFGYNRSEIQEKIERKREKYGITIKFKKETKPPSKEELAKEQYRALKNKRCNEVTEEMKIRWKIVRSSALKIRHQINV